MAAIFHSGTPWKLFHCFRYKITWLRKFGLRCYCNETCYVRSYVLALFGHAKFQENLVTAFLFSRSGPKVNKRPYISKTVGILSLNMYF